MKPLTGSRDQTSSLQQSRPEFRNDLNALMPFTLALLPEAHRETAAVEIFHAILEVCSWWP